MVLLICRWTDADVPGRFTTFRHVRRPLQRTSGLSPRSSEVCKLHRGPTSRNTACCDRPPDPDDTQLSAEPPITSIAASISIMEHCVDAVHAWCSAKRLQLNPSKSEIIWFGTRATFKRLENTNLSLHVGTDTVTPSYVVRDLGVLLDSELTMRQYISKIVFLPSSTSDEGPADFRIQCNMHTRHCICYESSRLLQRASGGPSTVNHLAAATSPERRCPLS